MCADIRVVRNPCGLEKRTPNLAVTFPFDDGFMTEPFGVGAICAEKLQEHRSAAGDLSLEGKVLGLTRSDDECRALAVRCNAWRVVRLFVAAQIGCQHRL